PLAKCAIVAVGVLAGLVGGPAALHGQQVRITVTAVDSATGKPVGFAVVYVDEGCVGQADSMGALTVHFGGGSSCVVLRVAALGYADAVEKVCFRGGETERTVMVRLSPRTIPMSPVTVEASRPRLLTVGPARYALRGALLDLAPLWPGDAVRFMQTLPAVSFRSDFSSSFYAAGSDFYQSAVYWNGTPALNCTHLGGVVSSLVVMPGDSIVASTLVPPSVSPLALGGALEIWSRPDSSWVVDLNPVAAIVGYAGVGGRVAYSAHARALHLASIGEAAGVKLPYNFADGGAWCRARLGRNIQAEGNLFVARDLLRVETGGWKEHPGVRWGILWGNTLARTAITWKGPGSWASQSAVMLSDFRLHGNGPRDHLSSSLCITELSQSVSSSVSGCRWQGSVAYRRYLASHNWDLSSRELWDLVGDPARLLFDFAPRRFQYREGLSVLIPSWDSKACRGPLSVELSIRAHLLQRHWDLPLLSASAALLREAEQLQAGILAGKNVQLHYARKQDLNEQVFEPASAFFLCTDPRQALTVRYLAATVGVAGRMLSGQALAYAKRFDNLPLTDFLRRDEVKGSGQAYGAGLSVILSLPKLAVSASLDVARAFLRERRWYVAHYERPVHAKFSAEWRPGRRLVFHALANAASGLPYTEVDLKFRGLPDLSGEADGFYQGLIYASGPDEETEWRGTFSQLFGARTPAYFRLDVGLEYGIKRSAGAEWSFYIRVFNVTNQENALAYFRNIEEVGAEKKRVRGLMRLPMIGVRYQATSGGRRQ
ncbi:MAG: hypothetical protein H5U38_14875, partial [Calditrichaeota bacterium]|nr:hypothetical protein [Calditrichota bacterium]